MVVKDTCLFVVNKYTRPHTCVNPCLNRDHHQLDLNLVAAHIKAIIKAQFTLTTVKPRENPNFLKNGKMVISIKIQIFSRSRMMKRTSPLESSLKI